MLNQAAFTFARQDGYLYRNDTQEFWYWSENYLFETAPSLKYDYNGNVMKMATILGWAKFWLALKALLAFGLLSLINGMLIRVAIMCSNIIIFPMLSCASSMLRNSLSRWQIAAIYRSSPHIGQFAAYFDRQGLSKCPLIFAYLFCLMAFYFMYASCYLLWT